MTCPLHSEENAGTLLDYTAGRLDSATAARLEQHMDACAECALFREQQAALWVALDAWETPPVGMDFNRTMWAKIDAANAEPWYTRLGHALRLGTWKPVAPLALAGLIIAAGFLMDHPADRTAVHGTAVTASEADQVEETLDDIQLLYQFESAGVESAADTAAPRQM